ncbi:MAG: hypothetical protein IJ852_03190 [Alphaproteobacteria bacterium]|nr:hypothetical protein [Alphaproteobacteria bacterium]
MRFLHYILMLPLVICAAVVIYLADSASGITFVPFFNEEFNVKVILALVLIFGYFCGRLNSWFVYAPTRRDLRLQKKANKALHKEHNKLNETVTGLQQDITNMKATPAVSSPVSGATRGLLAEIKNKFSAKKGNS